MQNFFDKDFYPTPDEVIEMMCSGLDLAGKRILEPSAGSGNIVDYLKTFGAEVMACESHPKLASIISQKCRFLKPDFLKVEPHEISHVDFIIMNPPFSADEKHILHAFEIAPAGCTIVALCNYATLKNNYTTNREKLTNVIKLNGHSENLGSVFSTAERKTDVEIGMITLHKPGSGENEFEGYFDMSEEMDHQQNGIMQYSEVQNIVSRYVGAVKMWEQVDSVSKQINATLKPIDSGLGIGFGAHWTSSDKKYSVLDRDIFKKELQKSAWRSIFEKFKMDKYVTKGVLADINKFVEQQQSVPFTVKNIYRMLEMLVGTHAGRMEKVLVEAFDKICSFSAENSDAGEKWKTNSNYKVNQKFILPYMVAGDWGYMRISHYASDRQSDMDDIVKALCHLTGKNYDETKSLNEKVEVRNFPTLREFCSNTYERDEEGNRIKAKNGYSDVLRTLDFGKWYQWNEFFEIRGYKKGTLHVKFVSESVWMEFNRRVSKIKGWQIPQKTDNKTKGTERTKKTGVDQYNFSHQ